MNSASFSLWRLHSSILTKAVSLAIAVSFVFSPLAAYAQDAGTDTPPADSGVSTPPPDMGVDTTPPPAPDFSVPGLDTTAPAEEESAAPPDSSPASIPESDTTPDASAPVNDETVPTDASEPTDTTDNTDQQAQTESLSSFGDGSPTILNPGVFSGQNYSRVSGATGAYTQNIQIDIPPGRNGLQPNVVLQYNSQAGQDSIVGYGWTISIPYIQRLNKLGSQNLYGANSTGQYFTSSIDGELATSSATSTAYAAKVDDGSFNSYTLSNNVWTMYDKQGTRYLFGAADNSQQNASASSTQIYKWMLQEVRDTNNNFVRYVYTKDSGEIYPSQILYTGNGGTDGAFTVDFTKESRADPYINSLPGFKVTTNYRINKITASASGTIVREYNLAYASGSNTKRSLLSSVQENGWDQDHQNQVTYPAISMSYINSSSVFVTTDVAVNNAAYVVSDVNGNSINDRSIFYFPEAGHLGGTIAYDVTGWIPNLVPYDHWASASPVFAPLERGVRFVDLNADGRADLIHGDYDYINSIPNYGLFLNSTTSSFAWYPSSYGSSTIPQFSLNGITSGILGDVNGDGLPDYEQQANGLGGSGITNGAYMGNGEAWNAATTSVFGPPMSFPTTQSTVTNSQLIDISGDGLQDWVYSDSLNTYVLLNTGTGWEGTPSSQWTIATSTLFLQPGSSPAFYYDRGIRFLDINGDGLPDFVRAYSNSDTANGKEIASYKFVMLNTGGGWATSTVYTLPTYITTGSASGLSYSEYNVWNGNGQNAQDVLQTVTYAQGGTATITYAKSAGSSNAELPYSLLTVSTITSNDGLGTTAQKTYTYTGGKQYSSLGVRERKFAGFAQSTEADPNAITTTYFDQGDTINTSLGEQNDGYAQIGKPFRVDVQKLSDLSLMRKSFIRWDTATGTLASSTFVFKAREVTQDYASNGSHRDSAADYSYSTTTGNVSQVIRYGEVTGNSDGTFTDTGTDKATETILYAVSTTTQARSLPYDNTVVDQSSNKVREARRTYDGLALGSVSKANETKTENWITGSTYASTTKTYDGTYGLVTQARDPIGNLTTFTIDSKNLYIATSTNALSQTTGYQYDYSTGKVKATFDANNRLNTTLYDGIGRILSVNIPDPVSGATVTKTAYSYTDSSTPGSTSVTQTDYLNAATSSVSYLYFDGLNRKIQSRKTAEASGYAVRDWTYNNVGLLNSETLPYSLVGSARGPVATTSTLFTTYSYDALQRVANIGNAVGTTSNAYNAWTVTTTDPNGKIKDYVKDAYGNLATVVEHISTTTATTTYSWDLNKNLTKITDALGNVRNFTYDGLNNRLTAQDLHGTSDSSFAVSTSTYDVASNLKQTLDAKGQTVNFTYDALNRNLTEDYTGGSGTEIQYAYDTCADGKGRLCAATTSDAVTNLTYSSNGLVASEKKTIDNTAYTTSYLYDRQGNITDLTYPDSSVVRYGYDNVGLLDTISRKAPGSSTYVKAIWELRYAPTGAIVYKRAGNGVETKYTYDDTKLYRLIRMMSTASTTLIGGGSGGTGQLGAASDRFSNFAAARQTGGGTEVASALPLSGAQILERVKPQTIAVAGLDQSAVSLITSPTSSRTPISDQLVGKDAKERAGIKGQEIAKLGKLEKVSRGKYEIEVVSTTPIDDGVAVFARAWDKNGQIGFGRDGSIDIERFLIHNPPVLVADAAGPVERSYFNRITGATTTVHYREDAREALLQTLEQILDVKSLKFSADNIVPEKVGNTTSTFYPDADPEVSSVDGTPYRNAGPTGETWSTIINGAGTDAVDNVSGLEIAINAATAANKFTQIERSILVFDTSALPDADILDSATVSLYGTYGSSSVEGFMTAADCGIYGASPASATAIAPSDYQTFSSSKYSDTTLLAGSTFNDHGFNDYPFNTVGRANVSKTGATKIGWRNANYDGAGVSPPNWSGGIANRIYGANAADFTGTVNDPKLVVEHSVDPVGGLQDIRYTYDNNGNITQLTDQSSTNALKTLVFGYDDVNRLTSASTTVASSTPFSQTYSYNSIGNLTNKSDVGSYSYAGTNDANPHAPTSIAGGTVAYDLNGNVTSGSSKFYSWDYRSRITVAGNGTATSTYGYDHQNQRVRKVFANATTTYPNKYMSKVVSGSNATTTDYIYMGDTIIAEVETGPGTSGGGGGGVSTSTIGFDATSTSITLTSSGTTTKTWTHTVSGSNPVIVLTADLQQTATGTGSIASATWNGGTFTKATSTRTGAMEAEVWYLVATTTGAKTMSVIVNGSTTAMRLGAQSFTGVSPTWPLDVVKSANGNGGNPSVSVTPTMATDVVVATLSKYGGTAGGGGGGPSTSTPAHVQSTKAHDATTVTFANPVTTGNLVVVGITVFSQSLGANNITDNKGNTYTKIAEAINGVDHAGIYYAKNVTGGSSFQITSVADGTIAIHEYSGVSTSSNVVNATSTRTGTSNKLSTWAATSTVGNDLFFSVAWSQNDGDTWTAGNGYTLRQTETDNNSFERIATEDQVIASASSSVAWYTVTTSDLYAAALAAFRPQVTSGGGGGGGTSADATSSQTTLWKSSDTGTFGGASYKIATTSGTITDTYTTNASQEWVMAAIALRPATSTSAGGGSSATTTRYFLPDHLNSTNVITNASGTVIEVLDYYPYGSTRIDQTTNNFRENKQFVAQYSDAETNLSYLQARYYNNTNGQFLSEDPTFWGKQNLENPQSMNSYAYGNDNPINMSDPSGLSASSDAATQAQINVIKGQIAAIQAKVNQIQASITQSTFSRSVQQAAGGVWNPIAGYQSMMNKYLSGAERWGAGIGVAIGTVGSFFLPEARIADEAIVLRGGAPANFAADAFKIGASRTPGVEGFSAQCANGVCAAELAANLRNNQVGQTTAGIIRAAGGDVIRTPGLGSHVTVTGLDGKAASQLPWQFFRNPNPLTGI